MVINKKMVPQDGSGGVPDGVAEGVVATTTSDGNPPPVRPDQAVVSSGGVIQLNRPSIVKTIGRVAPRTRSGFNGGGGTRGGMMGMNNNNNNRRPFVRPMAPRPSNPIQRQGFDGVVDDRVLPDAGLPTEFLEGVLLFWHRFPRQPWREVLHSLLSLKLILQLFQGLKMASRILKVRTFLLRVYKLAENLLYFHS